MPNDSVNGKANGDLISRRALQFMSDVECTGDCTCCEYLIYSEDRPDWASGCALIDEAPSVDAVPVVHARWELHGNDDDCSSSYFCTNCGSGYDEELFYDHEHHAPYLFCPPLRCEDGFGVSI